mmetsp:Transcript_92511/g.299067  ORF Transcript_92511/g.299067 Transcript_92511/m.299067 type:complete len:462 (+) Transcript_92511:416-1801(+)
MTRGLARLRAKAMMNQKFALWLIMNSPLREEAREDGVPQDDPGELVDVADLIAVLPQCEDTPPAPLAPLHAPVVVEVEERVHEPVDLRTVRCTPAHRCEGVVRVEVRRDKGRVEGGVRQPAFSLVSLLIDDRLAEEALDALQQRRCALRRRLLRCRRERGHHRRREPAACGLAIELREADRRGVLVVVALALVLVHLLLQRFAELLRAETVGVGLRFAEALYEARTELRRSRQNVEPDGRVLHSEERRQLEAVDDAIGVAVAVEVEALLAEAPADACEAEDGLDRARAVHDLPLVDGLVRRETRHQPRRLGDLAQVKTLDDVCVTEPRQVGERDRRASVSHRRTLLAHACKHAVGAGGERFDVDGIGHPPHAVHVDQQNAVRRRLVASPLEGRRPAVGVHRLANASRPPADLAREVLAERLLEEQRDGAQFAWDARYGSDESHHARRFFDHRQREVPYVDH